ncbi:hypothetical protein AX761_20890 [Rhizobium sp. 58]|nr:hypothetical protein AX761_20890 [Rhizobium sp. 58]
MGSGLGTFGDALSKFPTAPAAGGGGGIGSWFSRLFGGAFVPNGAQAVGAASGGIGLFANGGISDKPAIFGEGPMVEAAVPLPNGRSIPVDMRMTHAMPRISSYERASRPAANSDQLKITIINNSSAPVTGQVEEAGTDERGRRQYRMVMSDAVADGLSAPGGKAGRTMNERYGVKKRGIVR